MRDAPEFFSDSFWEEIAELDELGRRAYSLRANSVAVGSISIELAAS